MTERIEYKVKQDGIIALNTNVRSAAESKALELMKQSPSEPVEIVTEYIRQEVRVFSPKRGVKDASVSGSRH
jgi:hypothetical protein